METVLASSVELKKVCVRNINILTKDDGSENELRGIL